MYVYNAEEAIRVVQLSFEHRIEFLLGASRFAEAVELFLDKKLIEKSSKLDRHQIMQLQWRAKDGHLN